ncbi:hypothetical protein [Embleya sp. NBC_00896]|uniref:DUF7691 family protein n=1 Tax=Embleya sp. NBC_00896 TaxID=2975961 RepID=UPI002F9151A2|nr:hypothetical protein OG928_41740 [Embleya sp. NBC_00896]
MSYGLNVYLVDLATVRGAIGSADDKLLRMIGGRFKSLLATDDAYFADEIAQGAPTRYEAVRAVLAGGPFEQAHAFQYGYAYRLICRFHGQLLDNSHFSPMRGLWLDTVDEGLTGLGVKAAGVSDFMYGSLPDALPRPDMYPYYGEWTADQCREALAQWESSTAEQRAALDSEVLEAAESCVEWWREAGAREGHGIVGFTA